MKRAALMLVLLLAGCGPAKPVHEPVAAVAQEPSLFELPFTLTDQDSVSRRLAEFRGQPFVVSMIYTHCTSVCPRVTADLQRLERSLTPEVRGRLRFVLCSLDPERDTSAAMRAFMRDHALDPERWTLLAAAPDDMRTLAAVLGVKFRPDANGEIAHSALFAVVDSGGVVRHQQTGTQDDLAGLTAAVTRVVTAAGPVQR